MGKSLLLLEKIKTLPNKNGCYLFLNEQKQIIYVGKSKYLQRRVASYFKKVSDPKTVKLVQEITDINFFVTYTEKEALILEHNLIKKFKPKFNVVLRDDKSYPYIIVTDQKNPRLEYVRVLPKKYLFAYGPFPDGSHAYQLLKVLQSLIPFYRCQTRNKNSKPCTYYLINQCSGACFKNVSWSYYQKQIRKLKQFFQQNDKAEIKQKLVKRLRRLAKMEQFEAAQKIKILLDKLDWLKTSDLIKLDTKSNMEFINFVFDNHQLFVVVLFFREGQLLFKDQTVLDCNYQENVTEIMLLFLQNLYSHNLLPDYIVLPKTLDKSVFKQIFKDKIKENLTDKEKQILKLTHHNAVIFYEQHLILQQNKIKTDDILKWLQTKLHLKHPPFQIDIFDVSNWGMGFHVGACCVYRNTLPIKEEWRKYNLSDEATKQQGDVVSMSQLVQRRYQSILQNKNTLSLPDLIIVDGGFAQIHAAKNALQKMANDVLNALPIVGLVKDEHHKTNKLVFLPNHSYVFQKHDLAFPFLTKIQSEVDRFARTSFSYKKRQQLKNNSLVDIKGISKIKAQMLFQQFHNLKNMQERSFQELNQIICNQTTTKRLIFFLKNIPKKN